jgi:hypothetical protein
VVLREAGVRATLLSSVRTASAERYSGSPDMRLDEPSRPDPFLPPSRPDSSPHPSTSRSVHDGLGSFALPEPRRGTLSIERTRPPARDLVDVHEFARNAAVSVPTVRRWIARGVLPAYRLSPTGSRPGMIGLDFARS